MPRIQNRIPVVFLLASALCGIQTGCGRSLPLDEDDILAIRIQPELSNLYIGQVVQLTVEGHFGDGSVRDLTAEPDLALRVNQSGIIDLLDGTRIAGRENGQVRLLAAYHGREDEVDVYVRYAALESISVYPGLLELDVGGYDQIEVRGSLTDGSALMLTLGAFGTTYRSDDAGVASVTEDGLVFGHRDGHAFILVEHGEHQAQVEVVVGEGAELMWIELVPASAAMDPGDTLSLELIGHLSDGSTLDLTGDPATVYSSSDTSVVSVSAGGQIAARAPGEATVSASHATFTARSTITVSGGIEPVDLEVTPAAVMLSLGATLQLTATATYDDGSRREVTGEADYRSSDPAVVRVDTSGLIMALEPGAAIVTVSFGGLEAICAVQVQDRVLVSLSIEPQDFALAPGQSAQLQVIGIFDDGSQQDLTSSNTGTHYLSSDPEVVSVDSEGRVLGIATGTAQIEAANAGLATYARVVVTGAELVGIEVIPQTLSLGIGEVGQLEVWAIYADGTQSLVTPEATLVSSDPAIAEVTASGFVTAVSGPGVCRITARYQGFEAGCDVMVETELLFVDVQPASALLDPGDDLQLVVLAFYSDGTVEEITTDAVYETSNPAVAIVDPGGLVRALAPGATTVTARFGGMSDTSQVQVLAPTLVALRIAPQTATLDIDETLQLEVTGVYSDGREEDVTDSAAYESGDTDVATVIAGGLVTARGAGHTTVRATLAGLSATCQVQVTAPTLVSVTIDPSSINLEFGETLQLEALASYSDGSVLVVTPDADWSSTDDSVATAAGGLVVANGEGLATVRASFGGFTGTCAVTVGPADLIWLTVEPPSASLDEGATLQLFVQAGYADGRIEEVTSQASYESSSPAAVQVDAGGLVTAAGGGQATVFARFGGLEATCQIQVQAAVLIALRVEPDSLVLGIGEAAPLTVWAEYSTGDVVDVTAQASYTSSEPAVAQVDAAGVVVAQATGIATVFARFEGFEATCQVQVPAPELIAVVVEPSTMTLDINGTGQLTVTALYEDGSTADVTLQADYTSSEPAVAVVPAGDGLVLALGAGTTEVNASYQGLGDSCAVEVLPPTLVEVEVIPESIVLFTGATAQLEVRAHYSDGSVDNVTVQAGYSTSDPAVATAGPGGLVTAQAPGSALITASFGGLDDSCAVEVTAPALVGIELLPESAALVTGDTLQFVVTGTYEDGSQADLTSAATGTTYQSSDPAIVEIDPDGLARALSAGGPVTVSASNGGFDDTASITVSDLHPVPEVDTVDPDQVLAGSGTVEITVSGAGFVDVSVATLDTLDLVTTFVDASTLQATIPAAQTAAVGLHEVAVYTPPPGGGTSDTVAFFVVGVPAVTTLSPDNGMQGTTVRVVFYGDGLLGCTVQPGNAGIVVSGLSYTADGTQLSATFTIDAGATPGTGPVTLTNLAGSTEVDFTVIEDTPLEDLVIGAGEVVYLEGVQPYHNITIGTGAVVFGTGNEPLQFLATGDILVRGEIYANGAPGEDGYYDPAWGGDAGPGGGGGGGGGDGELDGALPAAGGAGSPPGQSGQGDLGGGTPSGDGGGTGAGSGVSGGCGQGGGGGAFGGDGGAGGGDTGPGTGGAGGSANNQGSDFNGGTGGGGGSTCGPNCGGGGGGGGGVLVLAAVNGGDVTVDGALFAEGGEGGHGHVGTGGGGGGSGGRITVTTEGGIIVINDTLSVRGGNGADTDAGDAGGGGGGGRIIVDAGSGTVDDMLGYYNINGGAGGTSRDDGYEGFPGNPGIVDVRP